MSTLPCEFDDKTKYIEHQATSISPFQFIREYLVNSIQEVYRLQGVKISDKHIEVIVRQMMQKVEIIDPGNTGYLSGDRINRFEFQNSNVEIKHIKAHTGKHDRHSLGNEGADMLATLAIRGENQSNTLLIDDIYFNSI